MWWFQSIYSHNKEYELPDGKLIYVNEATFKCTESLFNPSLIGIEQDGIHKLVVNAINKCDNNIQGELFENICLCGGGALFKGMENRLSKELNILEDKSILVDGYLREYYSKHDLKPFYNDIVKLMKSFASAKPKIYSSPIAKYSIWIGGSILSSLSGFEEQWIQRDQYNESGVTVVHSKY